MSAASDTQGNINGELISAILHFALQFTNTSRLKFIGALKRQNVTTVGKSLALNPGHTFFCGFFKSSFSKGRVFLVATAVIVN